MLCVARADWYRDHLQRAYPNWRDREGDLARLAEIAARARGLDAFLGDLQLAERVEADEDVSGPARRVALSSIHQAKGLEWPVVFVLQVEARLLPLGLGGQRGQPRRGGAALLRRRHPGRGRALPLPAHRRAARLGHRGGRRSC